MAEGASGCTALPEGLGRRAAAMSAGTLPVLATIAILVVLALPASAAAEWAPIGPPRGNFTALLGSWSDLGTVYANSELGYIWTSIDGGLTWSYVSGRPSPSNGNLAGIDPGRATTIYWRSVEGIYRSTDAGNTWQRVLAGVSLTDIAISPAAPQTAFVYLDDSTVRRSDDGGASWHQVGTVEENFSEGSAALAIDPSHPSMQVFRELGASAAWQQSATLPPAQAVLRTDFARPERLYALGRAGVLRSVDGGFEFAAPPRAPSAAIVNQVLIGPDAASSLYAAAGDAAVTTGLVAYVSTFNHSTDGGKTWSTFAPPFQTTFGGQQFLPSSLRLTLDAQPGTLYSLAYPSVEPPAHVSYDDGATWQVLPLPAFGELPIALAAEPKLPGKLVEVGCRFTEMFVAPPLPSPFCTALRLYTTNTAGRHWNRVANLHLPTPLPYRADLRLDPVTGTTLYVLFGGTLYKNTAAHPQLAALPLPGPVADLTIDPTHPANLYAAASGLRRPLFKSTDGGATWTNSSLGLPRDTAVAAIAIDPTTPSTLYITTDQGPFQTTDSAATWHLMPTAGLFPGAALTTVTVSPAATPPTIYLGTLGAGLFVLHAEN